MHSVAVVVPIYQDDLPAIEWLALEYSLSRLRDDREVSFIAPERLDVHAYARRFPQVPVRRFANECFASIQGYNRLLLDPAFYAAFLRHEFMLVLQTDALLLRDELDRWLARPYDYVGAPWPEGVDILVNLDRYAGDYGQVVKARVGNGGLSLRRNRACIALMEEFPQALAYFTASASSEDLFFSIMGAVSTRFCLPNEWVAAQFSLELGAVRYHGINGGQPPMGGHAWTRYDAEFWLQWLDPVVAAEARRLLAG